MQMEITRELAIKVRNIVDAGLVKGVGVQVPGQMCVEAAVCYAMGLPHSDKPPCVAPAIRQLKIQLNDSAWSSDKARGTGMRRLALAQLGSAGVVDGVDFVRRVVEMTIRRFIPIALRAAASIHPIMEHKTALEKASVQCEQAVTLKDCEAAGWAAGEAGEAADEASEAAGWAGRAAGWAGRAADEATQDKLLSDFAEGVVQVLIEMKAPGCQWLDLAPIDAARE